MHQSAKVKRTERHIDRNEKLWGQKLMRSVWAGFRGSKIPSPHLDGGKAFQEEGTEGAEHGCCKNNWIHLGKY